uniref:rho GTPase-activating protein 44-like isoform X2 n=1 Tax=Myxine glutinosa TaxID=7769 RepID=UPI00358E76F3
MKKQFNRMRQLANQTVGRAEKTEVLSEDVLQAEKRLELVKTVAHNTHKKVFAYLQGQADYDKRMRKQPQLSIGQSLQEGSMMINDDSLFRRVLDVCGEAEGRLAVELTLHEMQVEREVLEPLNMLLEVEIPAIQKQRKHLAKLVLDMDSARARWQQSTKSGTPGSNLQTMAAKADTLREEMEEAVTKVEMGKDQLANDLSNFIAKEGEYAKYFSSLIESQAEYHRKSLQVLENVLPTLRMQQEEHLINTGQEIAFPIECCVGLLLQNGMQEEGLFRVAAAASRLKKLKIALDCGAVETQDYAGDPHAVAGALKSYLRELPEPLLTFSVYEQWIQASNFQDMDKRVQELKAVIETLPKANKENLRYLVKFLSRLCQSQDVNKMSPSNLAIVLGPNLLWPPGDGRTMTDMITTVSLHTAGIIEPIIQYADTFFPEEVEFIMPDTDGENESPTNNHNANYEPPNSPDAEQDTRPHSIATDNISMDFQQDGMGVRVMDTDWVARRGTLGPPRRTSSSSSALVPSPGAGGSSSPDVSLESPLTPGLTPPPPPTGPNTPTTPLLNMPSGGTSSVARPLTEEPQSTPWPYCHRRSPFPAPPAYGSLTYDINSNPRPSSIALPSTGVGTLGKRAVGGPQIPGHTLPTSLHGLRSTTLTQLQYACPRDGQQYSTQRPLGKEVTVVRSNTMPSSANVPENPVYAGPSPGIGQKGSKKAAPAPPHPKPPSRGQQQGLDGGDPSSSASSSPPSTPPAHHSTSQTPVTHQTLTLGLDAEQAPAPARPAGRPMPRPRQRPTVPPPPQPRPPSPAPEPSPVSHRTSMSTTV